LEGKITEGFWEAKSAERQQEEHTLLVWLREPEQTGKSRASPRPRSHFRTPESGAFSVPYADSGGESKLLPMVLSNYAVDAVIADPTYRKLFGMSFEPGKTKEWRTRRDLNSQPLRSKRSALSS
jgi:hypothetical protein